MVNKKSPPDARTPVGANLNDYYMQKEQPKLSVTVRKGDGPQAPTLNLILPSAPTNDIIDTCQKLCGKEINVQRIEPHKEK